MYSVDKFCSIIGDDHEVFFVGPDILEMLTHVSNTEIERCPSTYLYCIKKKRGSLSCMLYAYYRCALCNTQEEARSDDASVHCPITFCRLRSGIRSLRLDQRLLGSLYLLFRWHWDSGFQQNMMDFMLYIILPCTRGSEETCQRLTSSFEYTADDNGERLQLSPTSQSAVKTRGMRCTVA